ncbi:DUF5982 domain-containing protein [Leptospira sp. 96542]|nr:DUF5982 domain-containing protein [Leptospira sp. 96542]
MFFRLALFALVVQTYFFLPLIAADRPEDLPEWLGDFKKLDAKELENKREGSYFTGLPLFGSDPVSGSGLGVVANYFYNGDKSEPSFSYTPYEHMVSVAIYETNRSTKNYSVSWDAPYFLDSPYRIKTYLGHESNLHNLYFGVDQSSLNPLYYTDRNIDGGRSVRNANFSDFESANSFAKNKGVGREFLSTKRFNEYQFETTNGQISVDKTIFQVFRIWSGVEFSKNIVRTYDGTWTNTNDPITGLSVPSVETQTMVTRDAKAKEIIGSNGGYLNYIRAGIAYDTRDYEPDPDRGWLIEYNINKAETGIGSDYSYIRHFGQIKNFYQPFPKLFEEFVVAQRAALTKVEGNVPFFEYRYLYSIDGAFGGLGGLNTLRGYRQERFVGSVMGFYNVEFRMRVGSFSLFDQNFQLSVVPFYDLGRVWDQLRNVNTMGYKHASGLGLRLIWDQATVILMDYSRSKEDELFYIDIGHTF